MDDTLSRQVVIAGAGIGGLSAALAFAERGYTVRLYEQASHIEAAGAGIQLSPNATHVLKRLGVLDRLLPSAVRPQAVVLKDASTLAELASVPLGEDGQRRWKAPYLVAHRGDLQNAMLAEIAGIPEIELVTGARLSTLATHSRGITASFLVEGNLKQA
ncbi:MAG TPA: FAD-binding protein, partial [Mesorhizobium sp.]